MDPLIQKELSKEEPSDFHSQMLTDTKALVQTSRKAMQMSYEKWDHNAQVFEQFHQLDQQDRKARERKEPEKQIFPLSYSQQMTFIAFCHTLYTQRERLFELMGNNLESQKPAKLMEALLARDLNYNQFEIKLFMFLLDIARFGIGVFKSSWKRETQQIRAQIVKPPLMQIFGVSLGGGTTEELQTATKFLGNDLMNVSPYRFFPDTRLPLVRFQEGEFVASEDEYSYVTLKQWEKDGVIVGTQFLKPYATKILEDRGQMQRRFTNDFNLVDAGIVDRGGQSKGKFIYTEVQRTLIPNEYKIGSDTLGEEDYPVKYIIGYCNDNRVVRCEPLGYIHDQFTYDVGQYTPDQLHLLSQSLSDSIDGLQSLVTWFLNSRVTSVRKVISDKLVVDPEGVEMKDLQDRNPIIRLKPFAAGRGVDKFIKQLDLQDVTQGHIKDVEFLKDFAQSATGINDNILGQFNVGRRSATEARNVNAGAASRLKMIASLLFVQCFVPMGQKMMSNLRDGLDEEAVIKLVGIDGMEDLPGFFKATKQDLVGSYDFEVFDGTLPSEKGQQATVLENILAEVMKNPQIAVALQIDPKALLLEIMILRGIRNPNRFLLQAPPQAEQPTNVAPMPGQPPQQTQLASLRGLTQPQPQGAPNGLADLIQ